MSRLTMGFQIFLALMFFAGIDVRAHPLERCGNIDFKEEFDALIADVNAESIYKYCTKMTTYFNCMNDTYRENIGLTIRELANHWLYKGTAAGDIFSKIVNMENSFKDFCPKGNESLSDFTKDTFCINPSRTAVSRVSFKHCITESEETYQMLKELQPEREFRDQDEKCILSAYQFGCVAAALHEACGVETFNNYKNIVKKNGFFKGGACSPGLVETLKTTLLQRLDMPESRKILYREILDL